MVAKATSNGNKKAGMLSIRVDDNLRERIEAFAAEHHLSISEAGRMLWAFAVTNGEDPRMRILYMISCDLRLQCTKLVREGMLNSLATINDWIVDALSKNTEVQ